MIILVANLGSTSFKFRLLDMSNESQLAVGGLERIGSEGGTGQFTLGEHQVDINETMPDHAAAFRIVLEHLCHDEHGVIDSLTSLQGIGFKAVHGGRISGARRVDEDVLDAMAEMSLAAPAHNPPYIAAMRSIGSAYPELPMVAAFETAFHHSIPESRRTYAIPKDWTDRLGVKRYGFHGASHRYIATRTAQLLGREDAKIISCHLGGSSSLTAIDGGKSVFTTMGMTPQTGLPQNNRVGDFDPFALPLIMADSGDDLSTTLAKLASEGGLKGISEGASDLRDLHQAATSGNQSAVLALDTFVEEIRRQLGGALVALGGCDAIVFTGGIGQNDSVVRRRVCENLESFGIAQDTTRTQETGTDAACELLPGEYSFQASQSSTQLWVVPTNEEIVVARQTVEVLQGASQTSSESQS